MTRRAEIEAVLRRLAPRLPPHEFGAVTDHATDSPALRPASTETAVWLSLVAYARHVHTEYDAMLEQGYGREAARHFVAAGMDAVLKGWGVRRPLLPEE